MLIIQRFVYSNLLVSDLILFAIVFVFIKNQCIFAKTICFYIICVVLQPHSIQCLYIFMNFYKYILIKIVRDWIRYDQLTF